MYIKWHICVYKSFKRDVRIYKFIIILNINKKNIKDIVISNIY